jgi:long-chain acyl-CoA synthetase
VVNTSGREHAEPVWVREYPTDVPARIDVSAYPSVADMLERSCERYRGRPACECMGTELSYDQLDRLSQDFASYLQNVLGLQRGDRVALMMPNLLQYPVALFGVLRAGMVVVNVNPLYTPRELQHQLKDSGARAIVILENFCRTLQEILEKTHVEAVLTTQAADLAPFPKSTAINFSARYLKRMVPRWRIDGTISFPRALLRGRAQAWKRVPLNHDDLAFLQYTGGTTGLSKGAQLTHGNIVANLEQIRSWIEPALRSYPSPEQEVVVTALPLYHIFALTVNALTFMAIGGKNLLIPNPRDLPGLVRELSMHRFTVFTGVNTLFNSLLNQAGFDRLDFSLLKFTVGGGASVQQAVAERWQKVTGRGLSEGYGLTETSPVVCFSPLDRPQWNGTIGVPLPSTQVALRDDDNRDVPQGEPGELCVHGPQVMSGYWQKAEETLKAFTPDGYLKTGDIAVMDERGYLRIVDRKKDMILVSGFNVYPNEIENVVALHPGVVECACIGVPDMKTGEAVKIFVVRRDESLTQQMLDAHCQAHLTGYKVPKHYAFKNELPKSNVGKILRKELRG